jgi:hypothetical protein
MSCWCWLGGVVLWPRSLGLWGFDPTPGVDRALERMDGQHLAVKVGGWNPLQRGSEMLDSMEHPVFCCDRQLGEVLMPKIGRVRDHQRATALGGHTLETLVLK